MFTTAKTLHHALALTVLATSKPSQNTLALEHIRITHDSNANTLTFESTDRYMLAEYQTEPIFMRADKTETIFMHATTIKAALPYLKSLPPSTQLNIKEIPSLPITLETDMQASFPAVNRLWPQEHNEEPAPHFNLNLDMLTRFTPAKLRQERGEQIVAHITVPPTPNKPIEIRMTPQFRVLIQPIRFPN